MTGNAADNILSGGAGNDTLIGGAGNDTFLFERGSGHDTIVINRAAFNKTGTDVVKFGPNIALDQLLFDLAGNDLEIRIAGTADKLTVTDWSTVAFPIWEFRTSDGQVLLDSEVHARVDAMASYTPPPTWHTLAASGDQPGLVAANMGAWI